MDGFLELLTQWGYGGLFLGAILAGSVLPFNSESVMAALYVAGLDPWALIFWGSLGNIIGSVIIIAGITLYAWSDRKEVST